MPNYLHTNGFTYTEEEVLNAAKEKNQSLEQFLINTPELSVSGQENFSGASFVAPRPQSRKTLSLRGEYEGDFESPIKIDHVDIKDMKDFTGFGLFTEKNFVKNMNERYAGTHIEFREAIPGTDAFVMYDKNTDETSPAIKLPKLGKLETYHQGYGIRSWENVYKNVVDFIDNPSVTSESYNKQRVKATNIIAERLEDNEFLTQVLGEDFDFSYAQKTEKGGKGEDYQLLLKTLKKQTGSFKGLFKGKFEPDIGFSDLSEQAVELIIIDAINQKFEKDIQEKSYEKEVELASTIEQEKTTTTRVDSANRQSKLNSFSKQEMDLYLGLEKIKELDPDSKEYAAQQAENEKLLKIVDRSKLRKGSSFLMDPITGVSINPESPSANAAVTVTEEELEEEKDRIKLTYGDNVELAFNANGRKKWLSDIKGEELYGITVNDPQASSIFNSLGYEPTGSDKMGYQYEIKLKDLARYYDATVNSDGFTFLSGAKGATVFSGKQDLASKFMGLFNIKDQAKFETPMGYFGLTEKDDQQQFSRKGWIQLTGIDEYTPGEDLSKPFKRMIKDYRDERFSLIKEGKVLGKMHLLNIDPASTRAMLPERGAEQILEGFRGITGGSQADVDFMTSPREERDILETIASNSNITLTNTQKERIKRSNMYRVYEGVTGFVPAIAEFAVLDIAIKKGVGVLPGAAKLLTKLRGGNTLDKTLYHTYGIVKEEIKMKAAFDEHYHMGGGAGFYAVGNLIPSWKGKYNLFNTFMNANKSGVGGSLSVQAAANLEALIRDVRGKESWQTWVKENYADLELKNVDMLVDYFVFATVGAKGWAFGGGKNWKNNWRTTSRLEKLETELGNKVRILRGALKNQKATGRNEKAEETKKLLEKAEELFLGVHYRLEGIYQMNDWQDPEKATKMMERQDKNIKAVFGNDVSLKAVNERVDSKTGKRYFEFEDSAAEFSGDGKTIYVDVNRVQPGKIPHEVFHLTMKQIFKNNAPLLNRFKATIESSFQGKMFKNVEIRDNKGNLTGKFKNMNIEELVFNEHGHQRGGKTDFDKIKANEFLAYVAEVLADPRYYSKFVANGTWKKLKMDLNKFTNRHMGTSVIESGTKQDLIDFMANYSRTVLEGNVTRKQYNMFKKIREDMVFAEKIEADSRTEQRKNEEKSEEIMKTQMPSKSVELSSKTQKTYEDIVKGKEGLSLDRAIEQLTAPDPKDRTSVGGKNFDNIIYDLIERMYPDVYKNPDQRYTLALDMVYDINRGPDAKNRGVQGLIKEYEARKEFFENNNFVVFDSQGNKKLSKTQIEALESKYNAKAGSKEFIDQAKNEGYKGKQNLTKTVREGLIKRIHEIKERAIGQETFDKSIEEMRESGRDIVDTKGTGTFEFKSRDDIAKENIGKKKINPLDYVEPRDLVSIRKNTTELLTSTKNLQDLRPAKLTEAITPETQKILEKQFGRYKEVENKDGSITLEKVPKKDYYDISKELFETKEKELYELMLPESRDRYTSETTNAAKSTFAPVYKKVGEFTFAELNKGVAGEILTDSQKAEGRARMVKQPYRKGILTDIIFKGNRKDQHHKRMDYLMPHGAFTLTRKVLDNQLNNPRFVELLKKMNPGVYEGLQFDKVLNTIRENLRGTTPEALASSKYVPGFAEKIAKGQGARSAILEIIANNESLKAYKQEIMDQMKLNIEDLTTGQLFIKAGKAGRLLGVIEGEAVKPIIFEGRFDGKKGNSVYGELNKIIDKLVEKGVVNKELFNINKTLTEREKDAEFSRQFVEEFLPEFFNTFDSRLLNLQGPDRGGLGTTMGYGNQNFGFRPLVTRVSKKRGKITEHKIFDAEMRNGIFEGFEGVKETLPKNLKPKFLKVNDNVEVKEIVDNTLKTFETKKIDLMNPVNTRLRKVFIEKVKKQLSPDGTLKGYDKMLKSNEAMLEYTSAKLFDYINKTIISGEKGALEKAINNVSYLLQIQTSLGKGWFRGLASHNATTLKRNGTLDLSLSKRYRSEHEFQLANFTGNLLINILKYSGNKARFNENMKPLIREFKQSIISKELQLRIDKAEKGGPVSNIYSEKGMTTDITAKANFLLERQIMESIVDLKTGRTYAEIIDGRIQASSVYKKLKDVSKKASLPSKNVTLTEMARNMRIRDKALENGKTRKKISRGMSTFDFDETVGISENFVIARKGNKTKKIASNEWPFVGEKLKKEGWEMDFTDFNRVTKGKPGPLMQKMKNQIKKFGPDNVFILTARAPESAKAIHEYLKSEGINIPLKNITGLGNSTGEAKAMWMLEKFSEGYNDMYFVDDALPNVKAVKNVLDQLDIKSKVQQALASKDVNLEVNEIMEHSLGIESKKVFSKAEAKVRGKDIKRRKIFITDSAADLELLIEPLYGKGKQGIKNKEWFKKEFILPFERGTRDYNSARQSARNDYMALRKQNKDVIKLLPEAVEGTAFTHDMAMRVYLWNKAGYAIPDLAKTTQKKLVRYVENNPKLQAYAENFARITKQEMGLKEPSQNWWAETMAGEVTSVDRGVSRKQYLKEFIDVKNEIFSEVNLNKMESKLGTRWRENIEDMFDRMETGRTRSLKLDRGSAMMINYLNGSVGSIMNFNTRSAVLQTISTVNFLNMRENNPVAAARAMANTKQFVKDFKRLMNSDMLKQRRDGLEMNVTEAELASAASSSKNPINAIIAKVLKAGYLPTKFADSFAISFGGATFYRNRIKMYEKQGMSTKKAEKQAFLDFQVLAERTQQSSRADLLSKQQTSLIGRIILPFANTPMQMNRAGIKDILDLYKGRYKNNTEVAEKMGRITYYMGAQVAIFAGLQSALFAMLLGDDDVPEKSIERSKSFMLNSVSSSFLRGMGVAGAVIDGFKNATIEFGKQYSKGYNVDWNEVTEDLLNISPPIGSKYSKLDKAGEVFRYNKKEIQAKGFELKLGSPSLEASTLVIESLTNIPLNRWHTKSNNIKHSLNSDYALWQRAHMFGGWSPYGVGIVKPKKEKVKKEKVKEEKIEERKFITNPKKPIKKRKKSNERKFIVN